MQRTPGYYGTVEKYRNIRVDTLLPLGGSIARIRVDRGLMIGWVGWAQNIGGGHAEMVC